jgi:hypothetical protein
MYTGYCFTPTSNPRSNRLIIIIIVVVVVVVVIIIIIIIIIILFFISPTIFSGILLTLRKS